MEKHGVWGLRVATEDVELNFEQVFSADLEDDDAGDVVLTRDDSSNPRSVRSRMLSNQDTSETRSGRSRVRMYFVRSRTCQGCHTRLINRKAAPCREAKQTVG